MVPVRATPVGTGLPSRGGRTWGCLRPPGWWEPVRDAGGRVGVPPCSCGSGGGRGLARRPGGASGGGGHPGGSGGGLHLRGTRRVQWEGIGPGETRWVRGKGSPRREGVTSEGTGHFRGSRGRGVIPGGLGYTSGPEAQGRLSGGGVTLLGDSAQAGGAVPQSHSVPPIPAPPEFIPEPVGVRAQVGTRVPVPSLAERPV